MVVTNDEVRRMLTMLHPSASHIGQSTAGIYFRRVFSLSSRVTAPMIDIHMNGLVPILIDCLQRKSIPALQLDAAWALTNIACGSQFDTHLLLEHGIVSALQRVLATSQHRELRDQAIWAFGNIAADCIACRDVLRAAGIIEMVVNVIGTELYYPTPPAVHPLRTGLWCLANLCRGGIHTISTTIVRKAVHIASVVLLSTASDDEVVADACWTLAYISDDNMIAVQMILDETALVTQLVANIGADVRDRRVLAGSLRVIGNIVTGDDNQTAIVLDANVLDALARLIRIHSGQIRREAAWTLSNIAAGPVDHIERIFGVPHMLDTLLDAIYTADSKSRKETGWTLVTAITGCATWRIRWLAVRGTLMALHRLLMIDVRDERLIECVLHAIALMIDEHAVLIVSLRTRSDVLARLQQMTVEAGTAVQARARNLLDKVHSSNKMTNNNNKSPVIYQLQRDLL